jgi:hypothetical protein
MVATTKLIVDHRGILHYLLPFSELYYTAAEESSLLDKS